MSSDTIISYDLSNSQIIMTNYFEGTYLHHTDCCNWLCNVMHWRHLLSTVTLVFAVLLCVILQGVERPRSVYSTMPQWWHLTVLQYVAASFHLPSVSTANSNTVQYTKPYQQCEIPTIPAVVISKVLFLQSNITAAVVRSNSNLFLTSLHVCKNR